VRTLALIARDDVIAGILTIATPKHPAVPDASQQELFISTT
jgi:hypothetical protein